MPGHVPWHMRPQFVYTDMSPDVLAYLHQAAQYAQMQAKGIACNCSGREPPASISFLTNLTQYMNGGSESSQSIRLPSQGLLDSLCEVGQSSDW